MAYPEIPRVARIDLSSPQEARQSIALVMSHLEALDEFLENICRGQWHWENNWQGTWSDGYHYEGPPGQWQQEAQSGPPGNWQSEMQSGPPGNWQSEMQSDARAEWAERAESPPPPDEHQLFQRISGHSDGVNRAEGHGSLEESPQGSPMYNWYRDRGATEGARPESNTETSQREESAEGGQPESGSAETSQREESAEGDKSGSDASRDRETGGTTSSTNEGERSEASSGPRNEDTEGGQALEFAASRDAAGADETPDATAATAATAANADGDPDAQRRRGWRIGRSDRPTPLVDGTASEPPGVEEDQRPLGPLPPGLAGYRLKRAQQKSPPTPIPVEELRDAAVAKPIPIQKMPARRRAPEEAAVPAQPKAKPPPHGMAATAPPRKMPPVAKAAAAAAASTAPPVPMRNPTTTAVPPQPLSSYKAPPGVYKQPPTAAMPPAGPGTGPGALAQGVKVMKAPPGPRPNEGSFAVGPTSPPTMPPGLSNDDEDARTKSRAEAKEMFRKKSGPVPPAPKALNPADGEVEVVDV